MPELTAHEKYMAGIPLNELNAAVLRGNLEGAAAAAAAPAQAEAAAPGYAPMRLTRAMRVALKELRQSEGWAALVRLMEINSQAREQSAILLSQQDPLGNSAAIAEAWAYVKIFETVAEGLEEMVDLEVKKLDEEARG